MNGVPRTERTLILAPRGRDAAVAHSILSEARIGCIVCTDLSKLVAALDAGADTAVLTEESTHGSGIRLLYQWIGEQPAWSDFPFILLTEHGGGLERNPAAAQLTDTLGNVSFLERPFHPTTLVSMVRTALRGRRRQHECRRLNEELETRVEDRTAALASTNRLLLSQIAERERVESTLRQLQRMEAVGQLTSGVAHDFNNLLTVILGNTDFLERGLAKAGIDGKLAQRVDYIRAAAQRGAKLTDQLLSFSRRQKLEPRTLDLNETVQSMRDLLQSTLGGSIQIETDLDAALWPATADPTQLELAVLNLAINARDAMAVGGTLSVSTQNVTLGPPLYPEEPPAGDYVAVCVSDTGTGIPDDIRAKILEPFFTTKEVGKGSGLGLSQVLGFAKQSDGGMRIDSRLGEGTSALIYLPRSADPAHADDTLPARTLAAGAFRGAHILLVDDDKAVREVTRTMLDELGYRVDEADSGAAALDRLGALDRVDLLIIDFAMPGLNGADVVRIARAKRPDLPVLFVTGFADRAALSDLGESDILGKPFMGDELAQKVRLILASAGARARAYSHRAM